MHAIRHFMALALLTSAGAAQQIVWTVATPTGLSATAAAAAPVTQSLPAGALPASGSLAATAANFHADASVAWSTFTNPVHASFLLTQSLLVTSNAPSGSNAAAGPHTFLVHVSATTPAAVRLLLRHDALFTGGAPAGELSVDVGNDGTIELEAGEPSPILHAQLGPTPLPVLVRIGSALPAAGSSSQVFALEVSPHNLVEVDQVVADCGAQLFAAPTFVGAGVQFSAANASLTQPAVLVLGLSAQPLVLPPSGNMPCILIPAPDVLVLRVDSSPYVVPLPLAVRPIVAWAQAVYVNPQLVVSEGYRIQADL